MRTTLELPDALFRELKAKAAHEGVTLKVLLRRAVEQELSQVGNQAGKRCLQFPLLPSQSPGSLKITNAEIDDLLA